MINKRMVFIFGAVILLAIMVLYNTSVTSFWSPTTTNATTLTTRNSASLPQESVKNPSALILNYTELTEQNVPVSKQNSESQDVEEETATTIVTNTNQNQTVANQTNSNIQKQQQTKIVTAPKPAITNTANQQSQAASPVTQPSSQPVASQQPSDKSKSPASQSASASTSVTETKPVSTATPTNNPVKTPVPAITTTNVLPKQASEDTVQSKPRKLPASVSNDVMKKIADQVAKPTDNKNTPASKAAASTASTSKPAMWIRPNN
jgi:FtsZ-interacting cell division protein ZipA